MTRPSADDRIDEIVRRIDAIIEANHCEDRELQEALIEIARDRIWKRGFFARFRFWANVVTAAVPLAAAVGGVLYFLGWDVRPR